MTLQTTALSHIIRKTRLEESPLSYYWDNSDSLRRNRLAEETSHPERSPKILLIDDDPILCRLLDKAASTLGVELDYLLSIDKLSTLDLNSYQVALIDFDLGYINGYEITAFLQQKVPDMPVILISYQQHRDTRRWPHTIREFVHKKLGPFAILEAALEAYDMQELHKESHWH